MKCVVPVFRLRIGPRIVVGFTDRCTGFSSEIGKHLPEIDIPPELLLGVIHIRPIHKDRYPLHSNLLFSFYRASVASPPRAPISPHLPAAIFPTISPCPDKYTEDMKIDLFLLP